MRKRRAWTSPRTASPATTTKPLRLGQALGQVQRIHDPTGKPVGFFRGMRDGLGLALGLDAKEVGAVSEEQCPVGHGRGSLEVSVELIGGE